MQTEYKLYPDAAEKGLALKGNNNQINDFADEVGDIVAGDILMRGTDPQSQVKKCNDRAKFFAIAVADHQKQYFNKQVPVLEQGLIYMTAAEDVVAGDLAYLHDDSTINKTEADGRKIGLWKTTTANNALGVLEVIKII